MKLKIIPFLLIATCLTGCSNSKELKPGQALTIEAESSELSGVFSAGSKLGQEIDRGVIKCNETTLKRCSNGKCLTNFSKGGNTIQFKFKSSKKEKAILEISVSGKTGTNSNSFDSWYTCSLNGKTFETGATILSGTDDFTMRKFSVGIEIKKGKNKVKLVNKNDAEPGNLDSFTIKPVGAALTNITKATFGKVNKTSLEYHDTKEVTGVSKIDISDETVVALEGNKLVPKGIGEAYVKVNEEAPYVLQVKPTVVDVMLFTGQSNASGKATEKYAIDSESLENKAWEYKYNSTTNVYSPDPEGGRLESIKHPSGEWFVSKTEDYHLEGSKGSNCMPAFIETYVKTTGRKMIAIHAAKGAKKISHFQPGQSLYNDIIAKTKGAFDYIKKDIHYEVGRKFYMMIQGESDTTLTMTKKEYMRLYMNFHNGLKENFGFEFGGLVSTAKNSVYTPKGIMTVCQAKYELAMNNKDIIMTDNAPLTYLTDHPDYLLSDTTHFTAETYKKLGTSMAKSTISYLGYDELGKEGVEPGTYIERQNKIIKITLSGNSTMSVGETISLTPTFEVDKKIHDLNLPLCDTLKYSCDNPSIATIDEDGNVKAIGKGKVTITAKSVIDNVSTTKIININ